MARFIPKQFAENSTTSVVFGSFQEQGGNVGDGTISSDPATLQGGTAWPLGWKAATDNFFQIPRGEEMEGLERVLSAAIIQQFKDGLTFWQSEMPVTQYQTIVQYQTGSDLPKLYVNITGTSTSTPPNSDTTNWYMFLDTAKAFADVDLSNLSATGNDKFVTKDTVQTISGSKTFSAVPVMTEALTATDNSTKIPTTAWVQSNIGVVNYAGGSNIVATIRASSGTGYKPTKKGIIVLKENNAAGGINTLYIYNSSGTQVTSFNINSEANPSGSSSTVIIPVSQNFSYRMWGGNGLEMETLFFPYYSG